MTKIIETTHRGKKPRTVEVSSDWLVAQTGSIAFVGNTTLYLTPAMFDAILAEIKKADAA